MSQLNILVIAYVYNELQFIKHKIKWAREQNLNLYIIDNLSTDGTWEILQEHKIASHRFDTQGVFHLNNLKTEVLKTIHQLKPDWLIGSNGADTFYFTPQGLRKDIELAEQEGFDGLILDFFDIRNTGERYTEDLNLYEVYQHGIDMRQKRKPIVKYKEDLELFGDNFNPRFCKIIPDGVLLNYGMTKPAVERENTLRRRQLAWDIGLDPRFGSHYLRAQANNWCWDKNQLVHINDTPWAYTLKHMLSYGKN
jgi:hypothetical protein